MIASTDLTIDTSQIDPQHLLQCWRWLISPSHAVVLVSAIGDLFLRAEDGSIAWLDAGAGTTTRVAATHEEFAALLSDPERIAEWLMPDLIAILRGRLGRLGRKQCYSFK